MSAASTSKRAFAEAVKEHCINKNLGENGMLQYNSRGLGSSILALNQLVRGGNVENTVKEILGRQDPNETADLIVLIFHTRNARGGKGEKRLSYDMFLYVWEQHPVTAARLVPLFVHYGYWKDLFLILELSKTRMMAADFNVLRSSVNAVAADQLQKDIDSLNHYKADTEAVKHPTLSLLAKWLPREGSSLDRTIKFVGDFAQAVWPGEGKTQGVDDESDWKSAGKARYRRVVAELTSYLALPEVLLAAKREDEINFHRLASKATMRLRKVLMNEDSQGRPRSEDPKRIRLGERFMEHVAKKGLKGKQIMPHEIVSKILNGRVSRQEEMVLDAQWKDLWKGVEEQIKAKAAEDGCGDFNPTRMVPMADVSGSMYGVPMEVAVAMSIGLSQITHPAFQNMVLTFSTTPKFHMLNPGDTIVQKVRSLARADWCMSTDFEAAYDLILDVVRKNKLAREDMPALIVFSDMQFNSASRSGRLDVMHDVIRAKVYKVAKELGWEDAEPTPLVYWNLRNTNGHPVDKDTEGAVLLAGFSPSLLRMVMGGDALEEMEVEVVQADGSVQKEKARVTPEQILRKTLDDAMYDHVRVVLATSDEGCLKNYMPPEPVQDEDGFNVV